jgi:hypothetical protein
VKLLDPIVLDYSMFLGMFFQAAQAEFIEVGFDVITEVCKEENLSFTVPQKGMLQHFSKQKLMSMADSLCFIKDIIQKLNVFLI